MNLKYNTQLNYIQIIENHLKPAFGGCKIKTLNSKIIQEYTNSLKVNGYSESHLVGIITTLSEALKYAIHPLGYLQHTPCSLIVYPKYENTQKQRKEKRFIIQPNTFQKILNEFPESNHFHLPLVLGYHLGLRASETFALTWEDVDFNNNTISVNKAFGKRNFGNNVRRVLDNRTKEKTTWYFETTKTSNSNRVIKAGNTVIDLLKRLKEKQENNIKNYGEYYTNHYLKEELNEKVDKIHKIISAESSINVPYRKVNLYKRKWPIYFNGLF